MLMNMRCSRRRVPQIKRLFTTGLVNQKCLPSARRNVRCMPQRALLDTHSVSQMESKYDTVTTRLPKKQFLFHNVCLALETISLIFRSLYEGHSSSSSLQWNLSLYFKFFIFTLAAHCSTLFKMYTVKQLIYLVSGYTINSFEGSEYQNKCWRLNIYGYIVTCIKIN